MALETRQQLVDQLALLRRQLAAANLAEAFDPTERAHAQWAAKRVVAHMRDMLSGCSNGYHTVVPVFDHWQVDDLLLTDAWADGLLRRLAVCKAQLTWALAKVRELWEDTDA